MRDQEEAERSYQQALDLEPDNTLALFGLAAVRAGQGNTAETESILRRILAIDPGFTPARNALEQMKPGSCASMVCKHCLLNPCLLICLPGVFIELTKQFTGWRLISDPPSSVRCNCYC